MTAAARKIVPAGRRAMLAKVHLGAKELGLDDDARRDVMARVTGGKRSSAECTDAQLDLVLTEFRRLGWAPRSKAAGDRPRPAASPFAGKAKAMWTSLWNLGAVRSADARALEAFGRRQLGVDRLAWADQSQGYRLIEALKAMAEREGWSQDVAGLKPERRIWSLKARLVQRQAELLGQPAFRIAGLTERELDKLAAENGPAVRAARGVA
ncbi:MAG: regulatory protein GemA [Pseudomonadota bacterium]